MAATLVVNTGSTSIKCALYREGASIVSFSFEETDVGFDLCIERAGIRGKCMPITSAEYMDALSYAINEMIAQKDCEQVAEITAVAVRVVAPGDRFTKHQVIDDAYVGELKEAEQFAPLHVPPVLAAITDLRTALPHAILVAVSDSAFHRTMPSYAREYSILPSDANRFGIRRYGYHGISVSSVVRRMDAVLGNVPERALVLHLGGGTSVTALRRGESIETSMGFAPASGLMMNTRAGDLDAAAFLGLSTGLERDRIAMHHYLNNEGGFSAVAGVHDMRHVLKAWKEGEPRAIQAVSMFTHQLTKLAGGFATVLGGLDALVLTATAAIRNPEFRALVLAPLAPLGILIDEQKNSELVQEEGLIHAPGSVPIAVMRNNEFGEMARIASDLLAS